LIVTIKNTLPSALGEQVKEEAACFIFSSKSEEE
jgi:hypothetical protein